MDSRGFAVSTPLVTPTMYQSVQNPLSLKKEQQNSEIISHLITNACHFLYIVVEQMLYLYSLFFCFVTFYRQNKTKNNKNTTPSAQVQTLIGKSYSNRIDISNMTALSNNDAGLA